MSKEFSSLLLDLAPSMERSSALEIGLEFVNSLYIKKIFNGRKTDYIQTYVSCFHPDGNTSIVEIDAEDDLAKSGKVVSTIKVAPLTSPPRNQDLIALNQLRAEEERANDDDYTPGRLWIGIIQSVNDIISYVGKKKFPYKNIILLTDYSDEKDLVMFDESNETMRSLKNATQSFLESHQIILNVYDIGQDDEQNSTTRKSISEGWKNFSSRIPDNSKLFNREELLEKLSTPLAKTVKPIKLFKSEFRMFADPVVSLKKRTDKSVDNSDLSLSFEVEGYPGVKSDNPITQSLLDRDILDAPDGTDISEFKIKRFTERVRFEKRSKEDVAKIKAEKKRRRELAKAEKLKDEEGEDFDDWEAPEDDDLDLYTQKPVQDDELENAYKYMSEFIPQSEKLQRISKYQTAPGLDFLGVVSLDSLPKWQTTTESFMLFSALNSPMRNQTGFGSLVSSLIEMESVIIARFVKKQGDEVQIVVMIPVFIDDDEIKKRSNDAVSMEFTNMNKYAFSICRLATKENLRGSTFSRLDSLYTSSGKKITRHNKLLPTDEMNALMEDYVLQMNMDEIDISDDKFSSGLVPPSNFEKLNKIDKKLLQTKPSSHITEFALGLIIRKATKEGISAKKWTKIHNDEILNSESLTVSEKRFLEKMLVNKDRDSAAFELVQTKWDKLVKLLDVHLIEAAVKKEESDGDEDIEFLGDFDDDEKVDLDALLGLH